MPYFVPALKICKDAYDVVQPYLRLFDQIFFEGRGVGGVVKYLAEHVR